MHLRSDESTHCASAKPNRLLETSDTAGWRSLLLDHHEGSGESGIFETHSTNDLTLVVATSGRHRLDAFAQGCWRSALYEVGCAGMTPSNETARLQWQTHSIDQRFRTIHLYLPGSLVEEVCDEYRRVGQPAGPGRLSSLAFRDETVAIQAATVLAALRAGEPDLYAASAARWLVTHLLSRQADWRHVANDSRLPATIGDRRLARVVEFMSVHLDRQLTLTELAREAGMSVHHFGRRFRERTGLGPAAYLANLRIVRAQLLLRTTDLQIAEIGTRCGYPRANAFATAFLRRVGMTATSYRRCR